MNRWDQIQCQARDIASNVHMDPEARDKMADDLIKLVGLMIDAVGKGVAVDGESSISDPDDDSAHARYLVGEQLQREADNVVSESLSATVDIDRYHRPTPGDGCQCGHVLSVHNDGACTGEQYNREACKDSPCTGFVVKQLDPVWVHKDRRPEGLKVAPSDLIRAVVREELARAQERQEATMKQAVQDHWDSDQFKAQVRCLSEQDPCCICVPVLAKGRFVHSARCPKAYV